MLQRPGLLRHIWLPNHRTEKFPYLVIQHQDFGGAVAFFQDWVQAIVRKPLELRDTNALDGLLIQYIEQDRHDGFCRVEDNCLYNTAMARIPQLLLSVQV